MTYSLEFRWRIISLLRIYSLDVDILSDFLDRNDVPYTGGTSIRREGFMEENEQVKIRKSRWPAVVLARVDKYKLQTTFYLEELKEMLERKFPELTNSSLPTICLAPNFYLKLTRKVPTKAAARYDSKQYSFPGQLVFIDEISKDGRHAYRRYARSKKGAKVAVKLPWSRGNRVSVLAALNVNGVMAWESIPGTFTRRKFREAFCKNIIPKETHGH